MGQCKSINSSLSHLRTLFKNIKGAEAIKTHGRDGRLQGLMMQFLTKKNAEILSVFCLCPSIEFAQENSSVLDFCKLAKLSKVLKRKILMSCFHENTFYIQRLRFLIIFEFSLIN